MPRKSLRCLVEVNLRVVSAPGVRLPWRDNVYLTIQLFGQSRRTQITGPSFPMVFYDKLRFDKVFLYTYTLADVASELKRSTVLIELWQRTDLSRDVLLASFETSARQFIYPAPTFRPSYDSSTQELLMDTTFDFPDRGISPKLEFSTRAVITDSQVSTLHYWDDLALVRTIDYPERYRERCRTISSYIDVDDLDIYRYRRSLSPVVRHTVVVEEELPELDLRMSDHITDRVVTAIRRNQPSYYIDRYGYREYDFLEFPRFNPRSTITYGRKYLYP